MPDPDSAEVSATSETARTDCPFGSGKLRLAGSSAPACVQDFVGVGTEAVVELLQKVTPAREIHAGSQAVVGAPKSAPWESVANVEAAVRIAAVGALVLRHSTLRAIGKLVADSLLAAGAQRVAVAAAWLVRSVIASVLLRGLAYLDARYRSLAVGLIALPRMPQTASHPPPHLRAEDPSSAA